MNNVFFPQFCMAVSTHCLTFFGTDSGITFFSMNIAQFFFLIKKIQFHLCC